MWSVFRSSLGKISGPLWESAARVDEISNKVWNLCRAKKRGGSYLALRLSELNT